MQAGDKDARAGEKLHGCAKGDGKRVHGGDGDGGLVDGLQVPARGEEWCEVPCSQNHVSLCGLHGAVGPNASRG